MRPAFFFPGWLYLQPLGASLVPRGRGPSAGGGGSTQISQFQRVPGQGHGCAPGTHTQHTYRSSVRALELPLLAHPFLQGSLPWTVSPQSPGCSFPPHFWLETPLASSDAVQGRESLRGAGCSFFSSPHSTVVPNTEISTFFLPCPYFLKFYLKIKESRLV